MPETLFNSELASLALLNRVKLFMSRLAKI